MLKVIKSFKIYNLFMDDQYYRVVCLPFIRFTCCIVWRGMLTVFRLGLRAITHSDLKCTVKQ
jgi:hypothetical protein